MKPRVKKRDMGSTPAFALTGIRAQKSRLAADEPVVHARVGGALENPARAGAWDITAMLCANGGCFVSTRGASAVETRSGSNPEAAAARAHMAQGIFCGVPVLSFAG